MTRDGAIAENQTTGDTERISKRTQDADFQKSPEQQAAQDAAQLQGAASPTSPLPHVPGAAPKADTGKTERVMEHIDAAHTRKASKKAVRKAQAEATAGTKSSRLQFTDEERAAPELEKYIKKSDKAADRLDKAKAAIPKVLSSFRGVPSSRPQMLISLSRWIIILSVNIDGICISNGLSSGPSHCEISIDLIYTCPYIPLGYEFIAMSDRTSFTFILWLFFPQYATSLVYHL